MSAGTRIGVTGHQRREGLDWRWTRSTVAAVLREEAPVALALTSLAVGTDQIFAEEALRLGLEVVAVLPFGNYERCFEGEGLDGYRNLLAQCRSELVLDRVGTDEEAFLAAGIRVADDSDVLVAVWDGRPAEGLGGTADVVAHALGRGREIIHLDPFSRTVRRLTGQEPFSADPDRHGDR